MKKVISALVSVLAGTLILTACRDTADLRAESLAQWQAYCASKGKQFLWKDTEVNEDPLMKRVYVQGKCVGPGERGYQAPQPPEDEP
jgi:hypothetical protein